MTVSYNSISPVVVFEIDHINELHSCQEDCILVIIVAGHLEIILVSHSKELVTETVMFFSEVIQEFIVSSFDYKLFVFTSITATTTEAFAYAAAVMTMVSGSH